MISRPTQPPTSQRATSRAERRRPQSVRSASGGQAQLAQEEPRRGSRQKQAENGPRHQHRAESKAAPTTHTAAALGRRPPTSGATRPVEDSAPPHTVPSKGRGALPQGRWALLAPSRQRPKVLANPPQLTGPSPAPSQTRHGPGHEANSAQAEKAFPYGQKGGE